MLWHNKEHSRFPESAPSATRLTTVPTTEHSPISDNLHSYHHRLSFPHLPTPGSPHPNTFPTSSYPTSPSTSTRPSRTPYHLHQAFPHPLPPPPGLPAPPSTSPMPGPHLWLTPRSIESVTATPDTTVLAIIVGSEGEGGIAVPTLAQKEFCALMDSFMIIVLLSIYLLVLRNRNWKIKKILEVFLIS